MALEREHKFLIEGDFPEVGKLREACRASGLELRLSTPRDQHDVYYDTPDLRLLRAGAALRIRRFGDEVLATYKTAGEVRGSFHAREEIEQPYSAPWPADIASRLAAFGVLNTVGPLVALSTRRKRYLLWGAREDQDNAALAELSLDDVTVSHGDRQVHFRELELEAAPTLPDATFSNLADVLLPFGLRPHRGDKLSYALTQLGLWSPA